MTVPPSTRTAAAKARSAVARGDRVACGRSPCRLSVPTQLARPAACSTRPASSTPRSSPAACTACGKRDVSVIPGETLTSRNHGRPVGVDDQVGARQVAQPVRRVRAQGELGARLRHLGGDPGRGEELGRAGGVARRVVVDAAVGDDLDGRQRARALPGPRRPRRPPRRPRRGARRARSRRRRSRPSSPRAARRPRGRPSPRARTRPRAGLTTSGSPSRATTAASTAEAPSSRNVWCGSATAGGIRAPARASTAFATGLSNDSRHGSGREPTYGSPSSSSTSRIAPSSPGAPCSIGSTARGRSAASAASRSASTSRTTTSTPAARRASADAAPGAQRDVALVGEPAGEQDDRAVGGTRAVGGAHGWGGPLGGAHVRFGAGASDSRAAERRACGAEGGVQLQLLLDHPGEPPDALADPVGLGVAVRQAQAAPAEVAAGPA